MRIDLNMVKRCYKDYFGTFETIGKKRALIEISKKRASSPHDFTLTVLHELLHLWIAILGGTGIKVYSRKEHKVIYQVEQYVIRLSNKEKLWRIK